MPLKKDVVESEKVKKKRRIIRYGIVLIWGMAKEDAVLEQSVPVGIYKVMTRVTGVSKQWLFITSHAMGTQGH